MVGEEETSDREEEKCQTWFNISFWKTNQQDTNEGIIGPNTDTTSSAPTVV